MFPENFERKNREGKRGKMCAVSVIILFIQFTAMCWNITQNSRKWSGLWVQGWSTNWILHWNDSSKQRSQLDCPPECKNLYKCYPGIGAILKAWIFSLYEKGYLSEKDLLEWGYYFQENAFFYTKARWIALVLTHFVSTKPGHTWHKAYWVFQFTDLNWVRDLTLTLSKGRSFSYLDTLHRKRAIIKWNNSSKNYISWKNRSIHLWLQV